MYAAIVLHANFSLLEAIHPSYLETYPVSFSISSLTIIAARNLTVLINVQKYHHMVIEQCAGMSVMPFPL